MASLGILNWIQLLKNSVHFGTTSVLKWLKSIDLPIFPGVGKKADNVPYKQLEYLLSIHPILHHLLGIHRCNYKGERKKQKEEKQRKESTKSCDGTLNVNKYYLMPLDFIVPETYSSNILLCFGILA